MDGAPLVTDWLAVVGSSAGDNDPKRDDDHEIDGQMGFQMGMTAAPPAPHADHVVAGEDRVKRHPVRRCIENVPTNSSYNKCSLAILLINAGLPPYGQPCK